MSVPDVSASGLRPGWSVLCVCLNNICRSQMAEVVLRAYAARVGLALEVASAATRDWHVGSPPDSRAVAAASTRGYDLANNRARALVAEDFDRYDAILAMDANDLAVLEERRPAECRAAIGLFDPGGEDVPDPYFGERQSFEAVLQRIEAAAEQLIGTRPVET
ncbi:MAG: low molecular weight protein-tyrosine-phosphatase [Pseudomonadota bacterium]